MLLLLALMLETFSKNNTKEGNKVVLQKVQYSVYISCLLYIASTCVQIISLIITSVCLKIAFHYLLCFSNVHMYLLFLECNELHLHIKTSAYYLTLFYADF